MSVTWRSVAPSSSEPPRRSPMRSSSPIRFRSASVARAAFRAKMAMPSMAPEEWRSGTPYARISSPGTVFADAGEGSLPGPPVQDGPRQLRDLVLVPGREADAEDGLPDEPGRMPGHAQQLARVGVDVQQAAVPVGDDERPSPPGRAASPRAGTTRPRRRPPRVSCLRPVARAQAPGHGPARRPIRARQRTILSTGLTAGTRTRVRQSRGAVPPRHHQCCRHRSLAHHRRSPQALPHVRVVSQCA